MGSIPLEQRIVLSANLMSESPETLLLNKSVVKTDAAEVPAFASESPKENAVDAGDFYWLGGKKISLLQLSNERVAKVEQNKHTGDKFDALIDQGFLQNDWAISDSIDTDTLVLTGLKPDAFSSLAAKEDARDFVGQASPSNGILWSAPVFYSPEFNSRAVITNEISISLLPDTDADEFFGNGFESYRRISGTSNQYIAEIEEGAGPAVLQLANQLTNDTRVEWASPKIYSEIQSFAFPNDPLIGGQANLDNSGQLGAVVGADAHLREAWDYTSGLGADVVVAVLDTGVQTDHPDLNIWVNQGEIAGNGIDDDGNGWIDDINGWDFRNNDNNPNPSTAVDNHGTAVAGIAAAIGGNGLGVSGASQGAQIMPVPVVSNGSFLSYEDMASAIYYAAGRTEDENGFWDGADIINMSIGGGVPSSAFNEALQWAATNGRGGLGTAIFAAAGNSAPNYETHTVRVPFEPVTRDNYVAEWRYVKDSSISGGRDSAWLGEVTFPEGAVERFATPGIPLGWTTSGDANWTVADDQAHNYGTSQFVAQAGDISDNQVTRFRSPAFSAGFIGTGALSYKVWTDSQSTDELQLWLSTDGGLNFFHQPDFNSSGVKSVAIGVAYPASHASTIAVGASSDWDFRSDYSQYGTQLDLVAPSSGGFNLVTTTDRTGADGYSANDYTSTFGGTSASAPLAAGVAALMLAENPGLTAANIRSILSETADEIGGVAYDANGFNNFYGYGRVNARAALDAIHGGHWKFDETSGSIANDSEGPSNNGTLVDGATELLSVCSVRVISSSLTWLDVMFFLVHT